MKININILGMALFTSDERFIDMDTGLTYAVGLVDRGIIEFPERYAILPRFSMAAVYQAYLKKVFDELQIEDTKKLSAYPEFGLEYVPGDEDGFAKYMDVAYHFSDDVDHMLQYDRDMRTYQFDPTFPTSDEYVTDFMTRFTEKWCKEHGEEWFGEPITYIT